MVLYFLLDFYINLYLVHQTIYEFYQIATSSSKRTHWVYQANKNPVTLNYSNLQSKLPHRRSIPISICLYWFDSIPIRLSILLFHPNFEYLCKIIGCYIRMHLMWDRLFVFLKGIRYYLLKLEIELFGLMCDIFISKLS